MFKITFESKNYYFYFNNLYIKSEYLSESGMKTLISELNEFFNFRVSRIVERTSQAPEKVLYQTPASEKFPRDDDRHMEAVVIKFNRYFYETIVQMGGRFSKFSEDEQKNIIFNFLNIYFTIENGVPLDNFSVISYGPNGNSSIIKHRRKECVLSPSPAARGIADRMSGDASLLGEYLSPYEPETGRTIMYKGIVIARPQFVLEKHGIVIICDGFKYNYSSDSVIRERAQDRALQSMGYRVLRFSGFEISLDAEGCFREIENFIRRCGDPAVDITDGGIGEL